MNKLPEVRHPAVDHHYITSLSGVNIRGPSLFQPIDVRIGDILRATAMQCRYYGHLDSFYSVAEHSVMVSRIAVALSDHEAVVPALAHDLHEAYSGDVASPHKDMIGPGWREFEDGMERVVRQALGVADVSSEVWARVKTYDTMMLHRELVFLREHMPDWYDPEVEAMVPPQVRPHGLEWRNAEVFLADRIKAHAPQWLDLK